MEYLGRLEVADRRWLAYCTPSDKYLAGARPWGASAALAVGLLATGLLTAYLVLLAEEATGRESLVAERTSQLRESEQRFRRAIIEAPFPIMLHAEGGEVLLISNVWSDLTGYGREEISTVADWLGRARGDERNPAGSDISRLFHANERKDEGEQTITTSRNQKRVWHFSSSPLGRLPDGRRLVITMAMDVTDRDNAERKLLDAQQQLEIRVHERTTELKAINDVFQQALGDQ